MPTIHNAIAGHYNATYGDTPLDLGKTDAGIFFEVVKKGVPVRFEEWGDTIIDMVFRGYDVFVEMVLKEWLAAGVESAYWPWSDTPGKIDCIGEFAVNTPGAAAQALTLTAETCNPAGATGDVTGPSVITFHKALLVPDVAVRINLDNNPRLIPMRFQIFLWDKAATPPAEYHFFTYT